jgi:FMN reductase
MITRSTPLVVGIGGTLRQNSSSELALRHTLHRAASLGARTEIFVGPDLELPIYCSDIQERTDRARRLIDAMRRSNGIIVSSPSYHGSISGLIKNALDYAEDMRDDPDVYFDGRPVGCIAVALGPQAAVTTLGTLRSIAHSLRGWPTPAGGCINSNGKVFGPEGKPVDPQTETQLNIIAMQVVEFANMRSAYRQQRLCLVSSETA